MRTSYRTVDTAFSGPLRVPQVEIRPETLQVEDQQVEYTRVTFILSVSKPQGIALHLLFLKDGGANKSESM
jgi:hypothetical protein